MNSMSSTVKCERWYGGWGKGEGVPRQGGGVGFQCMGDRYVGGGGVL